MSRVTCHVSRPTTYDHVRSHGSGFLRQGAVVFGLGSFSYHLLEFAAYFILDLHPHCLDVVHTVNSFLSIIFILLQTTIIILYPRQRTYVLSPVIPPQNTIATCSCACHPMLTVRHLLCPRMNLRYGRGLPHLGLMHLVATNLVIWVRTVIR